MDRQQRVGHGSTLQDLTQTNLAGYETRIYLAGHDGRQTVQLVNKHEVSECSSSEEECVSLLQRHAATKLRLIVIVSQVSYLVQVTTTQNMT